jgi:hypothetical protein
VPPRGDATRGVAPFRSQARSRAELGEGTQRMANVFVNDNPLTYAGVAYVRRFFMALVVALASCSDPVTVHVITANTDGTFSPQWTTAASGDIVEWILPNRTDAIVRVTPTGPSPITCDTPAPWDPADLNNAVTGPMPVAAGGVFALSPFGAGLVAQSAACPMDTEVEVIDGTYLCRTEATGATMASTWADPEIDGVFIRLLWNQVEPADCASADVAICWNWSVVDREIQAAVDNGKLYSISVKAGDDGTPDWLFTTDALDPMPSYPFTVTVGPTRVGPTGGVTRLFFQDSGNDTPGCGAKMYLGDPTEQLVTGEHPYRDQYFDMLTALATHIKGRSDWYRALAAVKPSGANLQSAENRLPKRCDTSDLCPCNTETFATNGYTPTGLYDFYTAQFARLAELFPGKTQSYALIQQGFPRVTDSLIYQIDDDPLGNVQASNGIVADLPLPAEQTEAILAKGAAQAALDGFVWTVSHNGLGPTEAPNQHVLDAATADVTTVTGFQTNNKDKVPDRFALDETFVNLQTNAPEATYMEIYEERQWEVQQQNGAILDPAGSNLTLGGWGDILRARRRTVFPSLPDPEPGVHAAVVASDLAAGNPVVYYVNGSRCGQPGAEYGAITISGGE